MYSNLLWEKEEEEDEENERDLFLVFRRFEGKNSSPAGNRTPVSRVTGEDTHHYTTEDLAYAGENERYDIREREKWIRNVEKRVVPVRGIEPRPRR